MGTDINNKQNQQAHNIPCVHPHRPPPTRANQGCDQNNLINVNLQSTVNEGPSKLSHTNKSIQTNNLVEPFQSAYRKDHSTETALLRVFNDLLVEADLGKVSVLCLLDLSAAFDTLDHNIMLTRLEKSFRIKHIVLQWFQSYLKDREQTVVVADGVKSAGYVLKYGVPQGSVLG
ncbi:reverse transcriptase-like protein [Elysia marginata]|uniref:Reverse transcriptase-like protein n=1 Tax=Elysia marginata TaxID=1093978 RepID=A0AAV4GT34_9GAST|nr:reverse transcriptase-like protein [Elysia marginata]